MTLKKVHMDYITGLVVPDGLIINKAREIISSSVPEVTLGCGLLLDALRVMVKKKAIPPFEVEFEDGTSFVDKDGRLPHWGKGSEVSNGILEDLF